MSSWSVEFTEINRYEERDIEGGPLDPVTFSTESVGVVLDVIRVNERQPFASDLRTSVFGVFQGSHNPIPLSVGKTYVLFLDPHPLRMSYQPKAERGSDPYIFAMHVDQGGFEIVNGKLRVLVDGGELDAYNGWTVNRLKSERLTETR
jgi:hypothetical protein